MSALAKRLLSWNENWTELQRALWRDCGIPSTWRIQPWAFIPEVHAPALKAKIALLENSSVSEERMPYPKITYLENVVPWKYVTWDRKVADLEDET